MRTAAAAASSRLSAQMVWRELGKASFAVLGHVTPAGKPRTSGVMYAVHDRRVYVGVADDGWKAQQIATGDEVSVTVLVRRGGLLALVIPIPPATVTFRARATMHRAGTAQADHAPSELLKRLPAATRDDMALIELAPEGDFVTYGIGVSLRAFADPNAAPGRVSVA
jgi:hypothetical protein